jgi:hypothetical protein
MQQNQAHNGIAVQHYGNFMMVAAADVRRRGE